MKNILSRSLVGVIAIGVMFFVSACQQTIDLNSKFLSKEGFNVAALWPENSTMIVRFGIDDAAQGENLNKLMLKFPVNPLKFLKDEFINGMKREIYPVATAIEGESNQDAFVEKVDRGIEAFLSERNVFYFAGVNNLSRPEKMDFVVTMVMADKNSVMNVFNDHADKLKKSEQGGVIIYEPIESETSMWLLVIKDVLVLTNDQNLKDKAISVAGEQKPEVLIAKNRNFMMAMKDYSPNVFYLYLEYKNFTDFVLSLAESNGASAEEIKQVQNLFTSAGLGFVEDIEYETLKLVAQKDSLQFSTEVKLKSGESEIKKLLATKKNPQLLNKIPGEGVIFYMEDSDLAGQMKLIEKGFEIMPEFDGVMDEFRKFLSEQGLNYDTELLPMFSDNYAMILTSSGQTIPGFGFFVDSQKSKQTAIKLAGKLDQGLMQGYESAKQMGPASSFLSREVIKENILWKWKFSLDMVLSGSPQKIIELLAKEKVELFYGLLEDRYFTLALMPSLNENFGKNTLAWSVELRDLLSKTGNEQATVTIFNMKELIKLLERFEKVVIAAGDSFGDENYREVLKYLNQIEYFGGVQGKLKNDSVRSELILKFAN